MISVSDFRKRVETRYFRLSVSIDPVFDYETSSDFGKLGIFHHKRSNLETVPGDKTLINDANECFDNN